MREHTVLKVFLCILAVTFIGNQVYSSVYKPITTVSAEFYEEVDGIDITGIIIREEKIVTNDASGTLHFIAQDGSRVPKAGTVADIYETAEASLTVSRIAELTESISDIEEMQGYNDVQAADLSLANTKVQSALNELIRGCAAGDFAASSKDAAELLSSLNRRQLITGEQTDFSAQLTELKAQLDTLKASLPAPIGSIKAESSGYFVSSADGYETVISCSELDNITPEFLDNLAPEETPKNTIGKIVSDYEWFIAAKVSINDSLQYKVGDSLSIHTSLKSSPELSVTVKQINISETQDNAVIIFSCQQMNSELATMRVGNMKVVSKTYSGLKLPKKSLRVLDGKTGVYVVSSVTLKFVEVNVLFSNDDYIICSQEKSNENVLRLYDEVVIKGKRLYDGKIVG